MKKPAGKKAARPHERDSDGARPRLPGDPSETTTIARTVRVDQAGEFGALQIYKGQLAVLKGTHSEAAVREMAAAERAHLEAFDELLVARGIRPTALTPVWRTAGFLLGAGSALLSQRHAMACTVAVEEVIDAHYRRQAARLGPDEADLKQTIEAFRGDEVAHRDEAIRHGAERAAGYRPFTGAIKAGTRLAIWLSERV